MPAKTIPMAIGPEPAPLRRPGSGAVEEFAGPFAIRTARHDRRPGGLAFLRIGATGLQVTCCLTPRQLRELAAMATAAAADLERPAAPGLAPVVSIFRGCA